MINLYLRCIYKKKTIWLLSVFLLFLFQNAFALQNNSRSALIIGISHYNGPAADLLGVPADIEMAKEIALAMDIPEKNITVMRDEHATKKNVLDTLKVFSQKAADGGRVFIYFSGHGTRYFNPFINRCAEGLLTYDYESISNIEMAQATKYLNNSVDKSILMVDTCHSGGVLNPTNTRSVAGSKLVAKFASKDKLGEEVCTPVNYKTRSLFDETKTLGAIQENVVFISSARPDEVSWDQPGLGGVATQALKQCLLGGAKDLDSSGAVTLEEVRQCAQVIMDEKVPGPVQVASHVTIRGNRNLIPVIGNSPPPNSQINAVVPTPVLNTPNKPVKPPVQVVNNDPPSVPIVTQPVQPPQELPVQTLKPIKPPVQVVNNDPPSVPIVIQPVQPPQELPVQTLKPIKPPLVPPIVSFDVASLATLRDIESQANPLRKIDIKLAKKQLKINRDYLELQIKSQDEGYLYLVLLGSDKESFYLLYPNKLDEKNFIRAGQVLNIPSQAWKIKAAGPVGVDNILVLVSDSPRDLSKLGSFGSDTNSPFVYTLNNLKGRGELVDYMVGKGDDGKSEKFAAKMISVSEVK